MPKKEVNTPVPKRLPTSQVKTLISKQIPKQKIQKTTPINKIKPTYKYIGKESLAQLIRKSIPKQLIPTKRFATILGTMFLIVIILSVFQFPFNKLLSGDINVVVKIGYPFPFLELGADLEKSPLQFQNLLIDLVIYLIITYIIDVLINLILSIHLIKSKEELLKQPKIYKKETPTISNKITKKIFKGKSPKIKTKPNITPQ
ncbi:hypothetical protein HN903_01480 [archaeon]|jgi:hypothetical protein|nr:hypothetical protein [archaeon]MBT7128403.1 hypothetical protein [archaeon]